MKIDQKVNSVSLAFELSLLRTVQGHPNIVALANKYI